MLSAFAVWLCARFLISSSYQNPVGGEYDEPDFDDYEEDEEFVAEAVQTTEITETVTELL